MTRPRKQTVDWFPHSCDHGMTMYVLDKRYGIAGYYFWFRLLELLGNSEGHFIDAENPAKFEYLQAYTQTDKDTCNEILDLLSTLEAIDPKLWKDKLIWSDNFVKGLAALYRNRNLPLPVRPDNYREKPADEGQNPPETPQGRRVEEGKEGREGKEKDIPPRKSKKFETPLPDDFTISEAVRTWATGKGFSRLEDHLESFRDYALSRGKTYVDWDSAFKRAIREDWAKINSNGQNRQPTLKPGESHGNQLAGQTDKYATRQGRRTVDLDFPE